MKQYMVDKYAIKRYMKNTSQAQIRVTLSKNACQFLSKKDNITNYR